MTERWLPAVGWGGYYEVSDFGRVRSLDRVSTPRGRAPYARRGRMLRLCLDDAGQPVVRLYAKGRGLTVRVHTLVLGAFVGPRPAGLEACHFDGIPTNNNIGNLRWDTRSANVLDSVRHGTHVSNQQRGKKRAA